MNFSFIPEPRNASHAAFQARVMDRAKNLLADGYTIRFGYEDTEAAYMANSSVAGVTSPEGKFYIVNYRTNTCECECCIENKFCKHLIAVHLENDRREQAADDAQVAAYEADMASAECATGTDPYFNVDRF